jgi:ribosomal protein S18 acetylase RimI-like enzyme
MSDLSFSAVGSSEQARAFATLVSAFTEDPVERWLYPESKQYFMWFPKFLGAFGGKAFDEQTVWTLGEFFAVALWLPPGAQPDGDSISAVLTESVSPDQHGDVFSVLDQMASAHPMYPHWYLPRFGVDAAQRGRGLGGQLMEHCLKIVDASHLPGYLETPNPRTVSFYERHGFEVTGEAQAGACPPLVFMLRLRGSPGTRSAAYHRTRWADRVHVRVERGAAPVGTPVRFAKASNQHKVQGIDN